MLYTSDTVPSPLEVPQPSPDWAEARSSARMLGLVLLYIGIILGVVGLVALWLLINL